MSNEHAIEFVTAYTIIRQMAGLEMTGDITPDSWSRHLKHGKTPRTYHTAIRCLAKFSYWYRPKPDGSKRFYGDMLQISYADLMTILDTTKSDVTRACDYLVKEGYINREFRTINVRGKRYNNVMFISVNPERVAEITYPIHYGSYYIDPINMGVDSPINTGVDTPIHTGVDTPINTDVDTPTHTGVDPPINMGVDTPINTHVDPPINTDADTPINTDVDTPTHGC